MVVLALLKTITASLSVIYTATIKLLVLSKTHNNATDYFFKLMHFMCAIMPSYRFCRNYLFILQQLLANMYIITVDNAGIKTR